MTSRRQADRILEECGRGPDPATPFWVWLQHLAARLRDIFLARECAVYLRDGGAPTLTLWAYHGEEAPGAASASRRLDEVVGGPGPSRGSGLLAVPIRAGELCLGAVEVRRDPGAGFSPEEATALEAVASSLAHSIRAAVVTGCPLLHGCGAHDEARQRLGEVSVLYEAGRALGSTLDLHQVLQSITRLAATALRARSAILRLAEDETEGLRVASRFDVERETPCASADEPLAELVRRGKAPVLIPDLRQSPPFATHAGGAPASAMCAPLFRQEAVIGTLGLYGRVGVVGEPARFEETDLQLLVTLSTQVAVAIENARLFNAANRRASELAALREIGQAVTAQLELSAVLEAVVAGAMRLLGSQFAQIILWDEVGQRLRYGAAIGPEAERVRKQRLELGRGVNGSVALTRKPMILDDYQASPYALPEFPEVVATITAPVLFGERLLGILHSHTTEVGKRFTPDDLRLLQMLADQAAIAIENARLFEEARVRSARLNALSQLSRTVTSSLDLQRVFDYAVQAAVDLLDLALARVYVWREDTGLLHLEASAGAADLIPYPREAFAPGEGIVGTVFHSQVVVTVADAGRDPRYAERAWARQVGVKGVAVIPLLLGERAVGVLSVSRRADRAFDADEIGMLKSFAQHAVIAIENARLFHEAERLAQDNLLRLREISILNEIAMAMQGTMHLDALLEVILTGVTFGGGLGFNRAILLLADESRNVLEGRLGVGPASGEEAAQVWTALTSASHSLRDVIAERAVHVRRGGDTAFDRLARSLLIPLRPGAGILAQTVLEGRPFRVADARSDPRVCPEWEGRLDVDEFASVPLVAKGKVVGAIVADNKFNRKPITDRDLEFLSVFATQAGLAVESARVYTRLEEASLEVQRSHHQLLHRERLAALGEMAAHVVHEIRNPLVSIGGFARRLARRLLDREPEGQYAQIIAHEVDRLERIIRDVQGLSREVRPTLVKTDLHTLLQDCAVLFAERMATQRVMLRMDLRGPAPVLPLEPVQMKQAIVNLMANALDAMPDGGSLTLATRVVRGDAGQSVDQAIGQSGNGVGGAAADALPPRPLDESTTRPIDKSTGRPPGEEWVEVAVGDTGGGIPEGILSEVFNPFFTTKEAGTGLGLALVRRIARVHGGRVDVDNRPGEGVIFRIRLPKGAEVRREAAAD
jgi:GAF domain-containing protein